MSIDDEIKHKAELFNKFVKMDPQDLIDYEKQLATDERESYLEEQKYWRCQREYGDYSRVVAVTKKAGKELFGRWCATESGLGNNPTVFRVTGIKAGTPDGERYDVIDCHGTTVLTPERWFKCDKVHIMMFRFAPNFDIVPDVFVSTSFDAGDLCNFENFINELVRQTGDEMRWCKMNVCDFRDMLKENRDKYIERVDNRLMNNNIECVKKVYDLLGIK